MTLEGRAAEDGVRKEYARLAPIYDAKWSFYVAATTRETLARLTVRPGDRVLDVGCGTGALLEQLSRACPQAQLAGIDQAPEMLAVARRKLPGTVELREGLAEALPFDAGSFEVVVSCSAFHYFRAPAVALKEMGRVLRRGGRFVLTDWCGDYLTSRVCGWFVRRFKPAHFKIYRQREVRQLVEDAGYRNAGIERYKINWLWGMMTVGANKES